MSIFFHSVSCLFTLLVSSALQKIFSLIQSWKGSVFVYLPILVKLGRLILWFCQFHLFLKTLFLSFPSVCHRRKCSRNGRCQDTNPLALVIPHGARTPRQFTLVSGIFFFNSTVTCKCHIFYVYLYRKDKEGGLLEKTAFGRRKLVFLPWFASVNSFTLRRNCLYLLLSDNRWPRYWWGHTVLKLKEIVIEILSDISGTY